ncbi:potassium transporter [Amylibacter marinus]|uniref:Potassium transporter n=1 Tax=Amylibacter marinus TaxID=1475483 RepID=A0ABQ5VQY8_9RHOB|nr:monovalent cation:proton antiporter-2 (CPA2) family protein [Amylibacter marinus]GLQ33811.1 potassium transporter [Amylibacter marinus]
MDTFLLQATIYLAAACIAVPVAKRLGLGAVLGYLIAGVLIGPTFGWVGSETQDLQHFAEFGVVMMLFVVGLELEPKALWDMRAKLIGLGGLQVVLTTLVITAAFMTLGHIWTVALAIGLTFSLSSTAIVVQTLNEKSLMPTQGGRSAFSVLLSQDIAVIPMLALVPLLALSTPHATSHDAHASMSLIDGLPAWGVTLVTISAIALVILVGRFLTHPIFRYIAQARLREMFTAIALLLVVGIALLMTLVGLSPALGTFLAGVVLANSEFRHELEVDIEPFKGLLLGLFFITVGAGINFTILGTQPLSILGLTLMVMVLKGAVLWVLAIIFKLRGKDRILFALSLAQAGEFGFVMLATTAQNHVIPTGLIEKLSLIVALSMLLTPLLFILYEQIAKRLTAAPSLREHDTIDEQGTTIIVGMGRFGQIVNRMAIACEIKTVVIDHHIEQIETMRRFGVKGFFGDPTRPDVMHAAGLENCANLVVAVDDKEAAVKLVKNARKIRPDLRIIARAYDRDHVYRLYRAGATDIVRETFDSALRASRYMLEGSGWAGFDIENATDAFFKSDRGALAELAELWDPDVPSANNKPYVERARAINAEFATGFLANLANLGDAKEQDPKE